MRTTNSMGPMGFNIETPDGSTFATGIPPRREFQLKTSHLSTIEGSREFLGKYLPLASWHQLSRSGSYLLVMRFRQ
jgi:hypothetical protein